jgi:hypothetical protein
MLRHRAVRAVPPWDSATPCGALSSCYAVVPTISVAWLRKGVRFRWLPTRRKQLATTGSPGSPAESTVRQHEAETSSLRTGSPLLGRRTDLTGLYVRRVRLQRRASSSVWGMAGEPAACLLGRPLRQGGC